MHFSSDPVPPSETTGASKPPQETHHRATAASGRVRLTPATDAHIAPLAGIAHGGVAADDVPDVWREASIDEIAAGFAQRWPDRCSRGDLDFVILQGDQPIGLQSLTQVDRPDGIWETSGWVARPFQGHGHGTTARALAAAHAFDTLGATMIISHVFEGNTASMRVNEKIGYKPAGTEEISGYQIHRFTLTSDRFDRGRARLLPEPGHEG